MGSNPTATATISTNAERLLREGSAWTMTAAVAVGTPPPLDGEPWTARATVQSDAVCQFATATIRSRNLPVALAGLISWSGSAGAGATAGNRPATAVKWRTLSVSD